MHGFCTDSARFQNVQKVLFVAKSDKGCRNCRVKNNVALHKNDDEPKIPEIETNRRLALLISGPRVRVPGDAPQQQNPNFFPIGEGFGFFVFFGKQNESLASIEKRPRPYHKKARQTTVKTFCPACVRGPVRRETATGKKASAAALPGCLDPCAERCGCFLCLCFHRAVPSGARMVILPSTAASSISCSRKYSIRIS